MEKLKKRNIEQQKFQQPKCPHVITCFLLSCLVLVLEWQATAATPILTTATTTMTTISTESTTATRKLRNHEKPVSGKGGVRACIQSHRRNVEIDGTTTTSVGSSSCKHKSLSELIKTSPVILKALGAHIFNHDDDEDLRILHNSNDALLLKWQNEQNKVRASLKRQQKKQKFTSSSYSTTRKTAGETNSKQNKQNFSDAATNRAAMLASMNADAILITLTPETIYKGASLLKITPNAAELATSRSSSSSGSSGNSNNNLPNGGSFSSNTIDNNSGSSANGGLSSSYNNLSEASDLYEGQLNASIQPLSCFDENLLKMLPSDLIIFGKLITMEELQGHQDDLIMNIHDYTSSSSFSSSSILPQHSQKQRAKDVLKISINGLHRWSSQFENYVWKHLGWDDWSDFTVCSVSCGKGVQQRFRRCLLDNPMVNLNINFNNNENQNDDNVVVDTNFSVEVDEEVNEDNDSMMVDDEISEQHIKKNEVGNKSINENVVNKINENIDELTKVIKKNLTQTTDFVNRFNSNDNVLTQLDDTISGNMLHIVTTAKTNIHIENSTTEQPEVMTRLFQGYFNNKFNEKTLSLLTAATSTSLKEKKNTKKEQQEKWKIKHKKQKSTKLYSTMFCEGYNIEQRNCNSFECSDDINDLLKFYRKYPTNDETNTASAQTMMMEVNATPTVSPSLSTMNSSVTGTASLSSYTTSNEIDEAEINNQNSNTFTTPINMGYVQSWHNSLNFTIMLTLRVKNDSRTTATIFSIRNFTHNLYLESCKDGLRLYLERDKMTEMLPIKFNLYDYHWHQVAISIQNGDFISIHVDCSWTNSFIVSKRLFSLPLTADVEIGRGFKGELQQLLILPEHQERFQCSEKRTSINEVKRYIIDTFIDDYSN